MNDVGSFVTKSKNFDLTIVILDELESKILIGLIK